MYLFSDNIPRVWVSAAIMLVSFTVMLRSHTIHRLMRGCVVVGGGKGGRGGGSKRC